MQFIVCVIDCLRKDHVGCYGYARPTTPHVDRLAAASVIYRNSRSVFDRTLPTFCVLAAGSEDLGGPMRCPDYPTVPRVLAAQGVPSHLISANHVPYASCLDSWGYTHVSTFMKERIRTWAEDLGNARVLVEEAERLSGDFYLVLHFKETHGPYTARRYYHEFLDAAHPGPTLEVANEPGMPGTIYRGFMIGDERSAGFYISQYDGALRYIDEQIGRLADAFPDAHIVVTGDHGEAMGESNRYFCHGYGTFHELLEAPLIYRSPGGTFNIELEPVTHLHIPCTVLDAFGIAPPPQYTTPGLPVRRRSRHWVAHVPPGEMARRIPEDRA